MPGMTLSAEIMVGSRRVIAFFFDPLLRGVRESIREPLRVGYRPECGYGMHTICLCKGLSYVWGCDRYAIMSAAILSSGVAGGFDSAVG